jgi:hypothetical protein
VLSQEKDKPFCKWTRNEIFSVKLVYKHLCRNGAFVEKQDYFENKISVVADLA